MSFKSPWLLLGLLVLAAAVAVWLLLDRRRARYAVRYTNLDVLATVVSGRSWLRYVPAALLVLGLASLFVGLARPQVERTQLEERATVILVVDTSRSMQAEDVEPTRLGAAQEAIRTFLDRAPGDLRVGLVVFAGEAQVATPPTKDHQLVDTAVTDIDQYLVFGGTAIGDALQTAVDLGRQVTDVVPNDDGEIAAPASSTSTRTLAQAASCPEEKSPVSILFLSDGAQTRGLLQPLEGAALAREACFPVYTIALGTPDGVIERGPFGGIPGAQGLGPADSRASRSRDAPRDREDDRRRVLRGAHRRRARASVREPRLTARPRARSERGHVAVRRSRGRAPGVRRARGDVRVAAAAVATRPRS